MTEKNPFVSHRFSLAVARRMAATGMTRMSVGGFVKGVQDAKRDAFYGHPRAGWAGLGQTSRGIATEREKLMKKSFSGIKKAARQAPSAGRWPAHEVSLQPQGGAIRISRAQPCFVCGVKGSPEGDGRAFPLPLAKGALSGRTETIGSVFSAEKIAPGRLSRWPKTLWTY